METEHDELNQNLLCESINEEFLKPAIKSGTLSNEKHLSPAQIQSNLYSPGATSRRSGLKDSGSKVFSESKLGRDSKMAENLR